MIKRRQTVQKSVILDYLKKSKMHPSAEKIYNDLKPENETLSLSTVYRNLAQMTKDGIIRKITVDGKLDLFDGDILPHQHFVCKECGEVTDVSCKIELPKDDIGEIISVNAYFYGICRKCK